MVEKADERAVEKAAFTIQEAAILLGLNEITIRRAVKAGTLKAMQTGRGYRISKIDLQAFYQSLGGGKLFEEKGEAQS